MYIDGEYVWVPQRKCDLIAGLKRMGITSVADVPIRRLPKRQLTRTYCRARADLVRRRRRAEQRHIRQLELFPATE